MTSLYQYSPSKDKFVLKASVKGTTTYRVTGRKSGAEYQFKVKPYNKTSDGTVIWGSASAAFVTATEPAKPQISLSSTSKGKVAVSWNNVSGETGYQIYYSINKSSGYTKLTNVGTNKIKYTASKLSSGKTYYFKVRAYKKVNGKTIFGTFSSVKSIKVK
ncbi:MAG: fibronectin type III domain-containing protein [Clostridia bacterium]|nr:fibronectin type III domain-containing protein [Clostridia bacterium]MBQ7862817.1 fibronectin type III domain-containing protein [Clostridia bacterium]